MPLVTWIEAHPATTPILLAMFLAVPSVIYFFARLLHRDWTLQKRLAEATAALLESDQLHAREVEKVRQETLKSCGVEAEVRLGIAERRLAEVTRDLSWMPMKREQKLHEFDQNVSYEVARLEYHIDISEGDEQLPSLDELKKKGAYDRLVLIRDLDFEEKQLKITLEALQAEAVVHRATLAKKRMGPSVDDEAVAA